MPPPPPSQLLHLLRHRSVPASLFSAFRSLSSSSAPSDVAVSISAALSNPSATADIDRHLSLHFSDVHFNTPLLSQILDLSPAAGRPALDLYRHLVRRRAFSPSDHSLSLLIHYFGRRKDFKAVHLLLSEFRRSAARLSFSAAIDRLARAGRAVDAVKLFESVESEFNLKKDGSALKILVSALADHGFAGHAERIVKKTAEQIFPDEEICNELIRAWCNDLKLDEAKRLVDEILRGGFDLGTPAYNSILDCICRLCRKKDPVRMKSEAEQFLAQMEAKNIPRDAETFRVLIYNLCKIRGTEDAVNLFRRMGEWNCSPNSEIYLVLIRSLYQAARVLEGDEMITWMRSAGFGDALDRKAYYGFIKILCGIERVEHAMKVFRMMKGYGHAPGIKTYELLMGKLAEHNEVDRANALFKEAKARGVPVEPKVYKVNPKYVKKKEKKEKKRETLPEKMKKKRRRLKRLRLSFVKKPKSLRRVA